ncbi:MAG: hypothetical protein ACK4GM_14305, partial [Tabrizicola sp.]
MPPITRVIVVLDQTSGTLREDDGRLLGLDLAPSLQDLATGLSGVEILLALPGAADLPGAEALTGFAPAGLRLLPLGPLTYGDLGALSGGDPATALVSADRRLRGEARTAGFTPAAHPALIPMLARGVTPVAARIAGPRAVVERFAARSGAIPMQFQPAPVGWALIALIPPEAQATAAKMGLSVFPLACDPATEDLVWARLDAGDHGHQDDLAAALAGRPILYSEPGQILIALKPGETAEAFHLHGGHGHAEFLAPDPGLLQPALHEAVDFDVPDIGKLPEILEAVELDPAVRKILANIRPRCSVVTATYDSDLDRYTGVTALDAAGPIVS